MRQSELTEFCAELTEFAVKLSEFSFGYPQTCVYTDVCLGIAHVSGKGPLSGQGAKRVDTQCICPFRPTDSLGQKGQIHCVSARPLVPREGLYQIHGQSLNTHRDQHRSGGAQLFSETVLSKQYSARFLVVLLQTTGNPWDTGRCPKDFSEVYVLRGPNWGLFLYQRVPH